MMVPVLANSGFVPDVVIVGLAVYLGACFGSFLNVVIWRLPRRCLSLVKPGSHCPICKTPIKWFDNIPVFGWIFLRGKCRSCRTAISTRYPLVETLTACLFGVVVWFDVLAPDAVGNWQAWMLAITHCVFICLMIAAAFIDADLTVIPDEINWGGTAVILLLALASPMHGGVGGAASADNASAGDATDNMPQTIPAASAIHEGDITDLRNRQAMLDLASWTLLGVQREKPHEGEIRFKVTRLIGEKTILHPPPGHTRHEPIPGMPQWIRVQGEVYRLQFHRSAYVYEMIPVQPAVVPGSEQSMVANQWPVAGWFGDGDGANTGFTPHLRSFLGALFGALIAGGGMWLLRATATGFLIKKALLHGQGAAMGMGDVKLLMLFGAMLGWAAALVSIFVGAALALLVTVPMLLLKKQHLFPFGPFLAMAAVVILLFHGRLMAWLIEFYRPLIMAGAGG